MLPVILPCACCCCTCLRTTSDGRTQRRGTPVDLMQKCLACVSRVAESRDLLLQKQCMPFSLLMLSSLSLALFTSALHVRLHV